MACLVASACASWFPGAVATGISRLTMRNLGAIGSRTKRGEFRKRCAERGIPREEFDRRVVCPIGLPIGAETPAEIAVAVLAEVIRGYRTPPATGGTQGG